MDKDFLKASGIWILITEGSALAVFLLDSGLGKTQWLALLEILPLTIACTALLHFLLRFFKTAKAASLAGLAVGAGVAILGGAALIAITPSFESPALFAGGIMFSIPNGIGGALAGWMQGKARFSVAAGL